MQRFILTAALFAGLTFAQDLSEITSLPACGVCVSSMSDIQANSLTREKSTANMHQQHARQSVKLGLRNIRLRVPVQEHELRLRRPRLLHSSLRSGQSTR